MSSFLSRSAAVALVLLYAGSGSAAPLTPDDAVRAALEHDPTLGRAEADLLAARGALRSASGPRQNPHVEARASGSYLEVEAVQRLSVTGEGIAAARSARGERDAAELSLERARLETAARARLAWGAAAVASGSARLSAQAQELATRLRVATEARVAAGEASALDLRLARLEEATAAAAHLDALSTESDALRSLAHLTGLDPDAVDAVGDPLDASPAVPPSEPAGPPVAERSDVTAAGRRVDAARAALGRERAAIFPAVELGVFYEKDGDFTQVGPIVGVEVPLWQQNQGGVTSARAELLVAEREADAIRARAAVERVTSERSLAEMERTIDLLGQGLADEASEALASIEAGYRAGELDLLRTVLLRGEVVNGLDAILSARGAIAAARIDFLLASGNDALIPGGAE